MGFIRNKEIVPDFLVHLICILICAAIGGLYVCLAAVLFTALHFFVTGMRYGKIRKLCADIDSIIYGNYSVDIADYREGELAVLTDEIYKVLTRLKEQGEMLKKDKIWLMDSIADISHQLRTPLTSVNLLISMLSDEDTDIKRRHEIITELKKKLTSVEWLIESLLKMSRLDAGAVKFASEDTNLSDIIYGAYDTVAVPMELREQEFNYESTDEIIYCDKKWMVEAVSNIFKNCMEHTPLGGSINVSVKNTSVYTEITISDTGCGFEEKDIPHVFERFYKGSDSAEESFGIGLCLSNMIISSQNGTIKADNYNGSARFVIKLYKTIM